ncbi:trp operon repressor [Patescibacteria group bacterium]|nr:trp operon repressor [Patescibacteria group bacterium]MCL5091750.1 trp operon repressor [Patescibacteria group bacterium]
MKAIRQLTTVFAQMHAKKDMEDFLCGILTPKEIDELARRTKIVFFLKQGVPHHQIAQRLGVGVATVTRGANEIKKGRFSQRWWYSIYPRSGW